MKTLTDFKRALKVGTKLHCIFHQKYAGRNPDGTTNYVVEDRGVREVSIIQTNAFALKTTKSDGKVVDSYCAYPKATECKIIDSETIEFYETDRSGKQQLSLTYRFVA